MAPFPKGYSGKMEQIIVGVPSSSGTHLPVYVTQDQGFLAGNRIQVVNRDYEQGVSAIHSMFKDEVDIATPSEFPVVKTSFKEKNIWLIASLNKTPSFCPVGRQDRGIKTVSDLKGKRSGLRKASITEFYLGRSLTLEGMHMQDVRLIEVKSSGKRVEKKDN